MRKSILLLTFLLPVCAAWAQKSKLRDAREYLSEQNYKKALPAVNEAINHEDTKNNADAWFLRGMAYLQQALDTTANAPEAASESYTSLMKALVLKPDYGTEINNALYSNALLSYNEGVAAYKPNPAEAYRKFMRVLEIYNVNNGSRFASDKSFSGLVPSAKTNAAYSALSAGLDDDAARLLTELKASKDSNIYQSLIEVYQRQKNTAKLLATITEARNLFPASVLFRNLEINYYIQQGQSDVLLAKLEEAVRTDPSNPEILFNLANVYERSAFPKDASGVTTGKPANFSEMFTKAESTYRRAIDANPANADYQYNAGVLYYEAATEITKQMNKIKGMSAPEQKEYDALLAERNAQFAKALPFFETAYAILDPRAASLTTEEKITYQNTMIGLREIYSRQNNKEKTDEIKAKIDALRR